MATRREFIKLLCGAVPALPLVMGKALDGLAEAPETFNPETTYGLVEASATSGNFKVALNGDDVSDQCTAANDLEGWVLLLNLNKEGRIGCPLHYRKIYGRVRIMPWTDQ